MVFYADEERIRSARQEQPGGLERAEHEDEVVALEAVDRADDTHPPVVRIVSARLRDGKTRLRVWLSEAAALSVQWASPDWESGGARTVQRTAGYSRLTLPRSSKVRADAEDAAANAGLEVSTPVSR